MIHRETIHPFICQPLSYPLQGCGGLEPIPACNWKGAGYTQANLLRDKLHKLEQGAPADLFTLTHYVFDLYCTCSVKAKCKLCNHHIWSGLLPFTGHTVKIWDLQSSPELQLQPKVTNFITDSSGNYLWDRFFFKMLENCEYLCCAVIISISIIKGLSVYLCICLSS